MVPKDLVYIGLRDLDTPEKGLIKELGIKAYTVSASGEVALIKCTVLSRKAFYIDELIILINFTAIFYRCMTWIALASGK